MGAEPWSYFVPYEKDLNGALQKLREREFKAGRYNKDYLLGNPSAKPRTIDEVMELCDADGSRSILDMIEVVDAPHQRRSEPDFDAAEGVDAMISEALGGIDPDRLARVAPLAKEDLRDLYGTDTPTHDQVEKNQDFYDWLNRGEGIYVIVYKDNKPAEIFFAGLSFD
jgi:hypothetical protein